MIDAGTPAPDFTAPDDEGNPFTLSSLRGSRVVLHFFALAWTGVCASELTRLGELRVEIEAQGAAVLGVSCDSRFTLAAWKQAMGSTLRLVSDFWPHGEIGRRYGVFDDELGLDTRGTFVIDDIGIVRDVFSSPKLSVARDLDAYVEALKGL